ncbi:BPSL1445 family SYLF domain-containing lipoprotein [Pandoraea sputorum]|uniref:BPSL1445 family SYLF domain-containing lipoprotein n=1 Tax=Pandoraea sputorum TaxID=93222 RepID=UPI001242283C|nr:YSC84-related protein [Pandoraea sputorum]BET09913.1 lipoprotein [Pandoraea sputorum]VVE75195.1 lipoprotein [Pandoraea sputorum]
MQTRRHFVGASVVAAALFVALSGCSTTGSAPPTPEANASRKQSIDAAANGTLSRLFDTVPGSRELVGKARGVLVFPTVIQAGVIVGGQHGDGVLRVGTTSSGYYSISSASVGAQLGMQSKSMVYLFMTQEAFDKFRNASGWSVGADASVAVVKLGANGQVDTTTTTHPVEVFVMTNSGLMGDLSLSGTKISRLDL